MNIMHIMNILFPVFLWLALFPSLPHQPHHLEPAPRLWAQCEENLVLNYGFGRRVLSCLVIIQCNVTIWTPVSLSSTLDRSQKKGPRTILITLYQSQYFHLIHHNHLQWKAVGSKKREDFNVIIVGSGIGGICLGKQLVDLGIR